MSAERTTSLHEAIHELRELFDSQPSGVDLFESHLDAVIAAALRRTGVAGWQRIETAPKDGTRLLLARKQVMSGEWTVVSGHWNSGDAFNLPHWSTPISMHDPTHWMPVPTLDLFAEVPA